ncbi:MAG: hypothetical protein NTW50_01360 [Candidatus Berkelbacteria bacterium]|nr:hypothetical protein [Candidatus Berkelbacteria bacterium]
MYYPVPKNDLITANQIGQLSALLEERGIGREEFEGLLRWPDLVLDLLYEIRFEDRQKRTRWDYYIHIDYSVLNVFIMDYYGMQRGAVEDIPEVKSSDIGIFKFSLLDLYREGDYIAVIPARLKEMGFRPAMLRELHAFTKNFPNQHRGKDIVAMGTIIDHCRSKRYPMIIHRHGERSLNNSCESGYHLEERQLFLAVPL